MRDSITRKESFLKKDNSSKNNKREKSNHTSNSIRHSDKKHLNQESKKSNDGLTTEDFEYYSEVFNMFDKDHSGAIDLDELKEAMESCGIHPSEAELKKMMAGVVGEGQEEVHQSEFLKMVSIIKQQGELASSMDFLKEVMDLDGNGYISASDLFKVLDNTGERLSTDQIYEMLQYADDDMDGKVGFEDFCKVMTMV